MVAQYLVNLIQNRTLAACSPFECNRRQPCLDTAFTAVGTATSSFRMMKQPVGDKAAVSSMTFYALRN